MAVLLGPRVIPQRSRPRRCQLLVFPGPEAAGSPPAHPHRHRRQIGGVAPVGASGAGRRRREVPPCGSAAALEAPRAAAPERRCRPGCGSPPATCWPALRPPSPSLAPRPAGRRRCAERCPALLHDRGPSKFLRQTAPQLEFTGPLGWLCMCLSGSPTPQMDGWNTDGTADKKVS